MKHYSLLVSALLLTLLGCQSIPNSNLGNYFRSDATLTTDIQAAFYTNPQLQTVPIQIESHEGVVELNGYVKTIRQSDTAEAVASKIEGVKEVHNNLIVRK